MPALSFRRQFRNALRGWWREERVQHGTAGAAAHLARELLGYLRDSTPERRRGRYGDMEYDWEHRVNTTSGGVGWRERLLGVFHSPYQPTDAALFHEMMAALSIDFSQFTFIDLGSGKGRTLLMAAQYGFLGIVGVEVLRGLHEVAEQNVAGFQASALRSSIETICMDAEKYVFPETPLVVYLFNPLHGACLQRTLQRLESSLTQNPREVWIVYHNPQLKALIERSRVLVRVGGTGQYEIYRTHQG